MKPITALPETAAAAIRVILTDIDDTLTTHGRLTAEAYDAMWRLKAAGLRIVPVTGRPGGWCDHIARTWPVDAVIGENGALYFWYDEAEGRLRRRFAQDEAVRQANEAALAALARRIMDAVPGTAFASDQQYRHADIAIDFCEDVPPLGREAVDRILALCQAAGATAKVSSIHVNAWFGEHDKLTTTRLAMRALFDLDIDAANAQIAFLGDSPNDAPMFAAFANAIGVANVRDFADVMETLPRYVTEGRAGAGFAEAADAILARRPHR